VVERLFRGYFEQGRDIGDRRVLEDIAAEAGMEEAGARRAFAEDASLAAVIDLQGEGRRRGIEGVPFFVLPGEYAVSGAQPPAFWQTVLPRIGFAAHSACS
jgi:predicted DsbA family dithiol-disulfide isomerase